MARPKSKKWYNYLLPSFGGYRRSQDYPNFFAVATVGDPTSYPVNANSNGAILTCINRIVSRALDIPYITDDPGMSRVLMDPSYIRHQDRYHFWKAVYEAYLIDGSVHIIRQGNFLRATSKGTFKSEGAGYGSERAATASMWSLELPTNAWTTHTEDHRADTVATAYWGNGVSPVLVAKDAAAAYSGAIDQLGQDIDRGHVVDSVMKQEELYDDPGQTLEHMKELSDKLNSGRKFQRLTLPKGIAFDKLDGTSTHPPHTEQINQSIAAVARVYGVPLALLETATPSMQMPPIEQLDTQLLRNAVIPMIQGIASAMSHAFGVMIDIDEKRAALPARTGLGGLLMQLSQTGAMTINEIREVAGLPEHADGDQFPQTAGAAERQNDGQTNGDNTNDNNQA